jgi:hypothetical protein
MRISSRGTIWTAVDRGAGQDVAGLRLVDRGLGERGGDGLARAMALLVGRVRSALARGWLSDSHIALSSLACSGYQMGHGAALVADGAPGSGVRRSPVTTPISRR